MTQAFRSTSTEPAERGPESGRRAQRHAGPADPGAVLTAPQNHLEGGGATCCHPDPAAATVVAPENDLIPHQGAIAC